MNASAAPALAPRRRPEPDPGVGPRPRLRVVDARPRRFAARGRRTRVLCLVASVAVACVAFGLVYLHVLSAQKQFEINRLSAREQTAQSDYQTLRVAVESENSPASIAAAATRLGMHPAASITIVRGVGNRGTGTGNGSANPGGVANWPHIKSDLTDTP